MARTKSKFPIAKFKLSDFQEISNVRLLQFNLSPFQNVSNFKIVSFKLSGFQGQLINGTNSSQKGNLRGVFSGWKIHCLRRLELDGSTESFSRS